MMQGSSSIFILTGAGISAESGIATFRDKGGLWSKVKLEDVATPDAYARDPGRVQAFYNQRRADLQGIAPNAGHKALARLEREFTGSLALVTQNIDDLHEQAGCRDVIHMHGELKKAFCTACGEKRRQETDITLDALCEACGETGTVRPDVVWFGEIPYHLDLILERLNAADLFVSIGTSGAVYPAAGFVAEARSAGTPTLELNLEPSDGTRLFDEARHGPASVLVPAFIDEILAG